jgi:hypothetical protein
MRSSTFWFVLAALNLAAIMFGHGGTDATVGFWSCMILSEVTRGDTR